MYHHAQSKSQGTGGTEDGEPIRSTQPESKGGNQPTSTGAESVSRGTAGTTRSPGIAGDPITGGILSQLIAQTESQLAKARDCIDWYEREAKEFQDQLDNLKHLQRQMEQQQSDE